MVLAANCIAYYHNAQIFRRDTGLAQRDELGDGVILAVPCAGSERDERRTPYVHRAILSQVAHRPDREIDRAVDLAKARATLAGSGIVHDREHLHRRGGNAAVTIAVAKRQL